MTGTRRWLGCLIGLALHHLAIGQLPTTYANSPFDAANYLTGPNVTFSNVSFTGYSDQLRSFGGALSAIGIGEGIVLTTGLASYAGIDYAEEQLNSHQQYDNQSGGQHRPVPPNSAVYGDSDLDMINGISSVHNVAILEFDFVSTNTEVVFDFAFASEEYPEETCCPWNDVIGIFLSGPDILGTFSNNAVNLALIPGTTVPVNVNTINSGSASGLSQCEETDCSDLDPNWQTNSNYYNHNQPNTSALAGQFVYDGFTDVLHAQHAILCNQTYHIKIAICNTRDYNKDSGLFIRAGTIDSPYPQFLSNLVVTPQPVCEGDQLNLSIDGDPSWTYTWSTGQSGVGLQQITTTASSAIDEYSVSAEYLSGCFLELPELQGRVAVHPNPNVPPTCPGGDVYVQAEQFVDIVVPSSDTDPERVIIERTGGDAGGNFSVLNPLAQFQQGHYVWQPLASDIGFHTLECSVTDNNACGSLSSTCLYNIKVLCRYCPICVYFENRSPASLPLPELTVAGACIVAGTDVDPNQSNGPVLTGNAPVTFRAPVITLEPGFVAGPNFIADIDINACAEGCEDCCENWTGITHDSPPNVFTPNGDNVNDYWQVTDELHPYCAYSADHYELWIYTNTGEDLVYHRVGQGYCCPFRSKAPGVNVVSSISWDGRADGGPFCGGCWASDGVYYYVVEITSLCGGSTDFAGYFHLFDGPAGSGMMLEQNEEMEVMLRTTGEEQLADTLLHGTDKDVLVKGPAGPMASDFRVFPNPTRGIINLQGSTELRFAQVRDALGRVLLLERLQCERCVLDISSLSTGSYVLLIEDASGKAYREQVIRHQ